MRKSDFAANHKEFEDWLWRYIDFILDLLDNKAAFPFKYEKLELIEATVGRVCMRWGVLVEQDIITSLNRDSSIYANEIGLRLRKHMTRDECEAILVGRRYLDIPKASDAKGFGKRHLHPNLNPFDAITPKVKMDIDDFHLIRNLLAHQSNFARRVYARRMKNKHRFSRVPKPGDYLLAVNRKTKTMRWTEYLEAFLQASDLMCKRVS